VDAFIPAAPPAKFGVILELSRARKLLAGLPAEQRSLVAELFAIGDGMPSSGPEGQTGDQEDRRQAIRHAARAPLSLDEIRRLQGICMREDYPPPLRAEVTPCAPHPTACSRPSPPLKGRTLRNLIP
jgi:hypothetical protein